MHPDRYDGLIAYARAKRAQVALAREWAARVSPEDVVFHAMHPGWATTPGVTASIPGFEKVVGPLLRSPEDGADTICWLATAPEATETSGRFWLDRRPRSVVRIPGTRAATTESSRLWTWAIQQAEAFANVSVDT